MSGGKGTEQEQQKKKPGADTAEAAAKGSAGKVSGGSGLKLPPVGAMLPAGILSLQRLAGNRATTDAVTAAGRRSTLEDVGARLRALVGDSRSWGLAGAGQSSFAAISAAVDSYNRSIERGRGRGPQDSVLAAIDEQATTWVNTHRADGDRDRRGAVMELLEKLPVERRRVTDKQATGRYLSDMVAGSTPPGHRPFAETSTPFVALSSASKVGAAQRVDRGVFLDGILQRAALLGYSEDTEREYAATEEAERVGMSPAEHAAIRAYTGGDYHYINPATANAKGWMESKVAKPQLSSMIKPTDGTFEDTSADAGSHQLAISGQDRWISNLMQEGALHAAMATRGLAKLPRYTKPHYRGEGMAGAPKAGDMVTLSILTSTTSRIGTAQNFMGQTAHGDRPVGVIWVYTGGGGADVRGLSAVPTEAEVLVPPGSRYRVVEVREVNYVSSPMGGEAAEAFTAMQAAVWEGRYKAASKLVVARAEFVPDAKAAPAGAEQDKEEAGAPGQAAPAPAGAAAGPNPDTGSVRFAAKVKARALALSAKELEPKVTGDVKEVARTRKGKLVGLEHRFKTEESLARKLEDRARTRVSATTSAIDAVAAEAAKVNDTLRYTIVTPSARYAELSREIQGDMTSRSYQAGPAWNAWALSDTYKGHNLTYSAARPGGSRFLFEVQLHTQATFDTKSDIHGMYEEARAADTTPERRTELNRAMAARWAQVEVPKGVYSKAAAP